ncbi:MAG TPA: uroporphyrinogen-III synthase [Deltaproteobacteria bacterium]|mgnify:FL=1|nr:uroporphyrinogen-III synthase [Deltaproteobacteria bacterium]
MRFVSDQPSETFPLAGLRILVTRQDTPDSSLSRMLEYKGASVLKTPMTQIRPPTSWESFDKAVLQASNFDWAVFTSRKGVTHCFSRLEHLELSPVVIFSNLKIACVGQATAADLAENGIIAGLIPEQFQSEGLISAFSQFNLNEKIFWLIQAESPREILHHALQKQGAKIISTPVYRNVPAEKDYPFLLAELGENNIDWILFASPSAVKNFQTILPAGFWNNLTAKPKIACLGEVTADAVQNFGWSVQAKPDIQDFEHLVQLLCEMNLGDSDSR